MARPIRGDGRARNVVRLMKYRFPVLFALAAVMFCAAVSSVPFSASTAGAGEPDPFVTESLAALDGLVSKENCVVHDAADDDVANGVELPFVRCDDGVPPSGGGEAGIPVPAKYAADEDGNDWAGLRPPASVEETAEADATDDLQPEADNRITLDVDITLPPSRRVVKEFGLDVATVKKPKRGFPVIVLMHGCCGGSKVSWEATTVDAEREHWHHSNAWWASQGYVVVTYTARGFRNENDEGSTGTTQLDSRRYEINDYQYLIGLLADHDADRRATGEPPLLGIDPKRVGAVGGSYGGGFTWLALTDPSWASPAFARSMKLAAVVPKYGWTDLVEALVPSGHYRDTAAERPSRTIVAPTKPAKAASRHPIGVMKQSIVAGLYGTGNNSTGDHTTFPQYVHDAVLRLQQGEPYDGDEQIEALLETFLNDRSAYYQGSFWKAVKKGLEVPLFAAGAWTDPLFPTIETLRFYNKLKALDPDYPVQAYFGDYQHFTANKAKEWGDLCGDDHHVCTIDDFRDSEGEVNFAKAPSRVRKGIDTRINAFLDHFLKGKGRRPKMNVTSTTTICAANATEDYPVDEPGVEYRASTWRGLTADPFVFGWEGGGFVTSAAIDAHAPDSDPVVRDRQTDKCYTTAQTNPGIGVAHLATEPLAVEMTMIGLPVLDLDFDTTDGEFWVSARLMDEDPDGNLTLVSRGYCKFNGDTDPDATCDNFALLGNAWTFEKGHRVVVEVSQSDTPFLRKPNAPTSMTINAANVSLPLAKPSRRHDFRD
ncbi:MAG: CocE/NonD family hydrolase C-terminal non-catalytic domain-containing protein [Actinomycetota bacterium]